MQLYENTYYKIGKQLASGVDLPEKVNGIFFKNCTFHPNVWDCCEFEKCIFENCDMDWFEEFGQFTDCLKIDGPNEFNIKHWRSLG